MPTGYTVDETKKQRIIEAHTKHKVPVSELSRSYGLNRKTIYKWLKEHREEEEQSVDTTYEAVKLSKDEENAALKELSKEGNETTIAMDHDLADRGLHGDDTAKRAADAKESENKDSAMQAAKDDDKPDKEAKAKGSACPNPSCDAKDFDGKECGKCGFRPDAIVSPYVKTTLG